MSDTDQLPKTYSADEVERETYRIWLEAGAFDAVPDARPRERRYVIMMPLPNVTGALHMGHAMDNVMQDLLIRWHRMLGDNTLWMPGTDHAGIATQAVVEKRLFELEGKTRHDVGRQGLVERIWRWKDQYQQRIIAQQQRMGCSCDWRRQRFTMDAVCARAVRHGFFHMFDDGLIFRGKRLVNWDVYLQTSVSDDEVYHETVQGHFWHLRYPVIDPRPGEPEHVVVATTRPETMLGDTAVAVHPDPASELAARVAKIEQTLDGAGDKERAALEQELAELRQRQRDVLPRLELLRDMARAGRAVRLPLMERAIPLICDEWAKPELGSGCVKITPAHDPNDYEVWRRHRDEIETINILEPDGTLGERAGSYAGLDRFAARERVVADLRERQLLALVEEREIEIGHSDRSKTPIEPYLSDQWFVFMGDRGSGVVMGRGTEREHRAPGLVQAAMDAVTEGRVKVHPERYAKTYLDWLAEKRDWPISRQLWWGHRIPVWSKRCVGPDAAQDVVAAIQQALGDPQQRDRVAARLHLPERELTVSLRELGKPNPSADLSDVLEQQGQAALGEAEVWLVDVCPLDDELPVIGQLVSLGFEQDPDVLDTWFSSALWPFSTLGWPDPESAPIDEGQAPLAGDQGRADALSYYYPGSCLVTGRDIITLWVARMVLAGLYNLGDIPFSDVFIHANILDGNGERMSKSKGNGIDPVDIIEQYGADAMRYVLCDMQTGTQDIRLPVTAVCPRCGHENDLAQTETGKSIFIRICNGCDGEFDVLGTMEDLPSGKLSSKRFEVGRSFCTKLWNSARFALINLQGGVPGGSLERDQLALEDRWVLDRLDDAVAAVNDGLAQYNPSTALNAARDFFWSSLCDWYLELIKSRLESEPSGTIARRVLAYCLDQVLRLLHPFVPFITEHLWQRLGGVASDRGLGQLAPLESSAMLIDAAWPEPRAALRDPELRGTFSDLQELTRAVREVRASAGVSPKVTIDLTIKPPPERVEELEQSKHVVERLAGSNPVVIDPEAQRRRGDAAKVVGDIELLVHGVIDEEAERQRLERQRDKLHQEIAACERKLGNPKFVERAPEHVVAEQRERLEGYRASLEAVQRSMSELS